MFTSLDEMAVLYLKYSFAHNTWYSILYCGLDQDNNKSAIDVPCITILLLFLAVCDASKFNVYCDVLILCTCT